MDCLALPSSWSSSPGHPTSSLGSPLWDPPGLFVRPAGLHDEMMELIHMEATTWLL